jgi:hypothetical protein
MDILTSGLRRSLTSSSMVRLWDLLVIVVVMLRLLIRLLSHALNGRQELVCSWRRYKTSRRPHGEAVASHRQVRLGLGLFHRIHLAPAHIFGRNDPRLVLESDLVLGALGDQVSVLLACCVQEIELLAPVAVSLRLCAVVAAWLVLVTFQVPFPACQAPRARPLRLALGCGIAFPFLGWLVARRVVPGGRRNYDRTRHLGFLPRASSCSGTGGGPVVRSASGTRAALDCARRTTLRRLFLCRVQFEIRAVSFLRISRWGTCNRYRTIVWVTFTAAGVTMGSVQSAILALRQ